jgi:hypothetical protein
MEELGIDRTRNLRDGPDGSVSITRMLQVVSRATVLAGHAHQPN